MNFFRKKKYGTFGPVLQHLPAAPKKRKRIIERLALGLTTAKKRLLLLSRVQNALGRKNKSCVAEHVRILEIHAIILPKKNHWLLGAGCCLNHRVHPWLQGDF